ncbi:RNA 2'-phosphotransferase [Gimesia fumaroli]|uniref:RNA 2'-phosphotransferase n=1 Tax=Gimesia fumaroli TaxID=2527976 RepID=A0A518IE38_9PLAN|nr:RNA 2'-phosphotransferase [Gimesia fumaroli]QDV51349.1 RNA 2'-phosphotransferase [Gimesia fumaroli]
MRNSTQFDIVAVSKATSHALRHEPWLYELELDDEGWTPVESLLASLRKERPEWAGLSRNDLVQMITRSSKQRHEILGGKVRALYGHTIAGKLKKTPATPPDVLFHGTSPDEQKKGSGPNGTACCSVTVCVHTIAFRC